MKFALTATVVLAGCASKPETLAKDSTPLDAPRASSSPRPDALLSPSRPPEDLAAIAGRLVHQDGSPAAGAHVTLVPDALGFLFRTLTHPALGGARCVPNAPSLHADADAQGKFRIDGLDPLLGWFLDVDLGAGAREIQRVDPSLCVGRTTDLGVVELPERRLRPGRLLDDRGMPVGGARLELVSEFNDMEVGGADGNDPDTALLFRSLKGEFYVWTAPAWLLPVFGRHPLFLGEGGAQSFRTDASGAFEAWLDRMDPLTLRVWTPGASDPIRGSDRRFIRQAQDKLDFVLPRVDDVEVRVVDAGGKAVGRAEVRIASLPVGDRDAQGGESAGPNPMVLSRPVATNGNGRAILRVDPEARMWIAVKAPGIASWIVRDRDARGGRTAEVRLPRPCSVVVRLKDASSRPASGELRVFATLPGIGPCSEVLEALPILAPPEIPSQTTRIGDGNYRLEGLAPGSYTVHALSDGWRIGSAEVSLDGSKEADVSIVLERARPIRLHVVSEEDGRKKPVAGALVSWMSGDGGQSLPSSLGAAFTDENGVVSIPDASRADLNLTIHHPRFAPAEDKLPPDAEPDPSIALNAGGSIEGHIHRAGRDPGLLMRVQIERQRAGEEPFGIDDSLAVVSDDHGRFRVDHLAAGEYSIHAHPASSSRPSASGLEATGQNGEAAAVVEDRRSTAVEVDLSTAAKPLRPGEGRLHGTILRDSEPWPGAIVSVDEDSGRRHGGTQQFLTDARGGFEVGPVEAGSYRVSIDLEGRRGGYETLAERFVELAAGQDSAVDFDVHFGRAIQGVVRNAVDGKGIEGARLTLCPKDRSSDAAEVLLGLHWADAGAEGRFEFPQLPVGDYLLVVRGEELAQSCVDVTVAAEPPGELAPIVLSPGAPVEGRAVFEAPKGLKRAGLRFSQLTDKDPKKSRLDPGLAECWIALDSQTNSFRTRSLGPGIYHVVLDLEAGVNFSFESKVIEVPAEGLKDLRLEFVRKERK